jgi:hypothetical protein
MKDVESRIIDVRDFSSKVKVLVYGDNGSGKTRFAATAPKPIIIDCNEKGTQSVRNYPDCKVFPAENWEDFAYAYWYLREGKHKFQSVIVDTLTMAQMLCIQAVLRQQEDRDPNRPPNMPDKRTWGQVGEMMTEQILRYRNLDMHVIFVAQKRKDFSEEDDAEDFFVPDISPASRAAATASVGIIGYMWQGKVKSVDKKKKKTSDKYAPKLLVGPHEKYKTKDRTGLLGSVVINPTMAQIIEANDTKEQADG